MTKTIVRENKNSINIIDILNQRKKFTRPPISNDKSDFMYIINQSNPHKKKLCHSANVPYKKVMI